MRLLIVDDDEQVRSALTRALTLRGHAVATASNGREALRALAEEPLPDAILLDIAMPELDGIGFLAERERCPAWQCLPVVVMTGESKLPILPVPIVRKPCSLSDLLAELTEVVSRGLAAGL